MTTKAQQQAIALAAARRRRAESEGQTTGTPLSLDGQLTPEQPVNMAADVAGAGAAGVSRGITGLLDFIPSGLAAAGNVGARAAEALGVSPEIAQGIRSGLQVTEPQLAREMASQATGGATEFRGETLPGQFAGTVGEFLPGAALVGGVNPASLAKGALIPGLGSEAAGQLTEGTDIEPVARIVGAIAAPAAVSVGTKPFRALFAKSNQAPTVENLKALKTEAYRAADKADITFSKQQTNRIITRAAKALDEADFVPEVDLQTKAAFDVLTKQASKPLTMGQLDKLRQGLWRRYNADKSQVAILDMIDAIDDTIQTSAQGGELMTAARIANSRFKKAELLDDAFTKAADQTASTGSGGNIVNKYKQAVTSIINNPKKAKWFSEQEIATMREFVRGSTRENLLRLGGKLSPSGNGLMAALNLGAVAVDPTMLAVTAGASGAKALSDRAAIQGAEAIQRMVATGRAPVSAPPIDPAKVGGGITGLLARDN